MAVSVPSLTAQQFIARWRASTLKERSGSQSHFNDLCALLGEPTPTSVDPDGTWYTFERGARKTGGGDGWADVWKKGRFAWEYKGKHKDLDAALKQLKLYATALENPPLLVVSDMETIRLHTNFTNTVEDIKVINLDDLEMPETLQILRWLFNDPDRLRPGTTRQMITEQAAKEFAGLAQRLRERDLSPDRVAHFVNKLLFCMFAEDIEYLPKGLFSRLLESAAIDPSRFVPMAGALFQAMKGGGFFGADSIEWFNGGLFEDDDVLPLNQTDLEQVLRVSRLDWSDIEPSIFGTLFERGLDPAKRSQLGAHYTDRQSIMRIVEPVVLQPLRSEWEAVKAEIADLMGKAGTAKSKAARSAARNKAQQLHQDFLHRLSEFRVLDPACGSGNFLYLSLLGLKDLENRVILDAEMHGLPRALPRVGPQVVLGIELNPYAAELARVTIWIGHIQWTLRNGWGMRDRPILQKLDRIANRDALLNPGGSEAEWPEAEAIVGNPPFLGDKKMLSELGDEYVNTLRKTFQGRVPGGADLATYWFEKARACIESGTARSAGLVCTNSIRGGLNRKVLDRIRDTGAIFNAWSDEPWVVEGAAVRVSLVCFGPKGAADCVLDGQPVEKIYADLTAGTGSHGRADLTVALPLSENKGVSFLGTQKNGAFDVPGDLARKWLKLPRNPNGKGNSEVVKPWANGLDILRRPSDTWIIDFGCEASEDESALFEAPFEHVRQAVLPERLNNRRDAYRSFWWRHAEPRPGMRSALAGLPRYIATPTLAKHRIFVFLPAAVLPDKQLVVFASSDEATFGILHSRFHESWALRLGTSLEDRPRYTPTSTFETFPFPPGISPAMRPETQAADPNAIAIVDAARRLNALREAWLNPTELVRRIPEAVAGYPDRLEPLDDAAAREIKTRTLTRLYNERPQWLANAHRDLDVAVAVAYGWEPGITEEDALRALLELNISRTKGRC